MKHLFLLARDPVYRHLCDRVKRLEEHLDLARDYSTRLYYREKLIPLAKEERDNYLKDH